MLERLLSDDFEADQSNKDALEREGRGAGGIEIQCYFPEAVLSMNKLDFSSNISVGDGDAFVGVSEPQMT